MKHSLLYFALFFWMVSCDNCPKSKVLNDSCLIFLKIPNLSEHKFDCPFFSKYKIDNSNKLTDSFYKNVYKNEALLFDSSYIAGKIVFRNSRIGIVVVKRTYECDQLIKKIDLDYL